MVGFIARRAMCLPRGGARYFSQKGMVETVRSAPTMTQAIGGAACLGLGALIASGFMQEASFTPASQRTLLRQMGGKAYAQRIRTRVGQTYAALSGSLAMTAAMATLMYRRGAHHKLMQMNQWVLLGGGMLSIMVTGGMCQATPMNNPMKYFWWTGFNATWAFMLTPIGMMGGALVSQAAMITACVVGSLSAVAAVAPGDAFLNMGPVVGMGFGLVIAASWGQMFFPASSMLMNIALYGGLGLFGLKTCYDTQKVLHNAQMHEQFDPINNQIGLYYDTIQIFIRVAQILMMSGRRK